MKLHFMNGDLVLVKHAHREPTIEKIAGVGKNHVLIHLPSGIESFHISRITPIMLTERMIDANHLDEFGDNDDGMQYGITTSADEHITVYESIGANIVFACHFVHQAQGLLRYLGEEQLADNFEI